MWQEYQKNFFKYGLHFLRELLVYKQTGQQSNRLLEIERKSMEKLAAAVDLSQLLPMIDLTNFALTYMDRNLNIRVQMTSDGIELHHIMKKELTEDKLLTIHYQNSI